MGKINENGYTRQITSLYNVMERLGIYIKTPSKKKAYEPKPYQKMSHPGERIQIDVKYVLQKCMSKELKELEEKYYQYIAMDEYTRQRVLWASKEHSTYASTQFLEIVIKKFKYKIECIQTDMSLLKVLYLSTLKAEKKWSRMVDKWDLCLSQFRIMYEGKI